VRSGAARSRTPACGVLGKGVDARGDTSGDNSSMGVADTLRHHGVSRDPRQPPPHALWVTPWATTYARSRVRQNYRNALLSLQPNAASYLFRKGISGMLTFLYVGDLGFRRRWTRIPLHRLRLPLLHLGGATTSILTACSILSPTNSSICVFSV